jgi:hypothetical protein
MIMLTHHQAHLYAAEHGNEFVQYRANSSEPWVVCSPICAWNPAPFEYCVAQAWHIYKPTPFGPAIRYNFNNEGSWRKALAVARTDFSVEINQTNATLKPKKKVALWSDVPRGVRVHAKHLELEFLGVTQNWVHGLQGFIPHGVLRSDAKLSDKQPNIAFQDNEDPQNYCIELYKKGFHTACYGSSYRLTGLRDGWEMEK